MEFLKNAQIELSQYLIKSIQKKAREEGRNGDKIERQRSMRERE